MWLEDCGKPFGDGRSGTQIASTGHCCKVTDQASAEGVNLPRALFARWARSGAMGL
jgi:hypothetical protein